MHKMGNLIFDGKGIIGHDLIVKMKRSIEMLLQGFPPITVNGTAKEPITALTIYGHSTQDGTPSPDNPVPIVSAGSSGQVNVSVGGGNLLDWQYFNDSVTSKGVTIVNNKDGSFSVEGQSESSSDIIQLAPKKTFTLNKGTYVISGCTSSFYLLLNNKNTGVFVVGNTNRVFTVDDEVNEFEGYIRTIGGSGTKTSIKPMLNIGETPIPYHPYVTPQTLIISTPGGLPGIPVSSDGNYTDESGQQWVCDEIDLARGKYVQRVGKTVVDGTEIKFTVGDTGNYWNLPQQSAPGISEQRIAISKYFPIGVFMGNMKYSFLFTEPTLMSPYFSLVDELNAFCAEKYADGQPLELYYIMAPIETDLPAEEIAAYKALHTYSPNTTVSNDADAWMEVGVIME